MKDWIANNWKKVVSYTAVAVGSLVAGQFLPNYFDFVAAERGRLQSVVSTVSISGDAVESTIPGVISVAIVASENGTALRDPLIELNDKMLELFQALEYVSKEFPEIAPQREQYVDAVVQLRQAAAELTDITKASDFVEAASLFKVARTSYEQRVSDLEPSYVSSLWRNLL